MTSSFAKSVTSGLALTNTMFQRVLSYFSAEMLTLRKLTRFWVLVVLLSSICQAGYLLACWHLAFHLPYNLSAGINAPKYLLGNVDPTIFLLFQWATLLIMFDTANRHERNRIVEVVNSKPIGNLEVLFGRSLAVAGIMWFLVALNVLLMQTIGYLSRFGWEFAETVQWHSVFNLLMVDGPINLIFWTSFIAFVTVILRARILVLLVGGVAMFGWYWLLIRSPYSVLTLVSPFSNDTLFVSELVPRFLSLDVTLVRISYLLLAVFFLACTACLLNRLDGFKTQRTNLILLPPSLACGIGLFVWGASELLKPFNEFEHWKSTHVEYEWVDDLDIHRISGTVHIDPPKSLETHFYITMVRSSGSSTKPLVFTLNPGMKIQELKIGGINTEYSFRNGLLEISNVDIEIGTPFELEIESRGKPKAHFAYLDGVVNYVSDTDVPVHSVKILGRDGTIFHPSYVALMPGGHWYPTPGPLHLKHRNLHRGRDFFSVELFVSLQPKTWSLVASTTATELTTTTGTYKLRSTDPVPEMGLFASRFKQATTQVGDIDFTMYLHESHKDNLVPIEGWNDIMRETAESWIEEYQYFNLPLLNKSISFVEVPRSLRTVGGGWRMDALDTLPGGLILLKEHGYPRANRQLAVKRYITSSGSGLDETAKSLVPLRMLKTYFQTGVGTDSPWTSLHKHLWVHHTSPKGEYAPILDQTINWIISSLHSRLNRQFSIYSTLQIADLTKLQFHAAREGSEDAMSSGDDMLSGWYEPRAVSFERRYIDRSSLWSHLERKSTSQKSAPYETKEDLEAMLLKSREIAATLLAVNGKEKVYQWINDIRTSYQGTTFTYAEFLNSARLNQIDYEPFLTEWITQGTLPALQVHEPFTRQIANNEHGEKQYQSTFVLRNTQPVTGYATLRVPLDETIGRSPFRTYRPIHSFSIKGNSVVRVNFVTEYVIGSFFLDPGLSYNRESLFFDIKVRDDWRDLAQQPLPTTETIDSFTSRQQIIVDDLDEGFQIDQKLPSLKPTPRFGPVAWFTEQYSEFELDAGLPTPGPYYGISKFLNIWRRENMGAGERPFGLYRQTYAVVETKTEDIPKAVFRTNLTSVGDWQLEYHYPWDWEDFFGSWGIPENGTLSLEIVQGDTKFVAPLEVRNMLHGWNEVGTYELKDKSVSVKIVYLPKTSSTWVEIYADAIRWTFKDAR